MGGWVDGLPNQATVGAMKLEKNLGGRRLILACIFGIKIHDLDATS